MRHQSPVENQIIGNVFYYNRYSGSNPAVWLASRNGWRTYCWDDNGFPWGSSVDNRDFARQNVVADNLVYVRSVGDMIVDDDDGPNYFFRNRRRRKQWNAFVDSDAFIWITCGLAVLGTVLLSYV